MFSRRSGIAVAILLSFVVTTLYSETDSSDSSTTFKSTVKVVLVDIAVTDRNDNPISGLKQQDFEVFEEGKPQIIASFEEHKGAPANQPDIPALPPHFYSNYPLNKQMDSVNVLVLDALNTELGDQANVRKQMVNYLKNIDPGPRLAIFTLNSRMRLVEGFTADPSLLIKALNHKDWGGSPESSRLLRTQAEDDLDQKIINDMATASHGDVTPQLQASIAAMKDFLQTTKDFQSYSRVEMTLQALQQLARYLGGFPGRKNVIWFSGSFPIGILPTQGQDYDFNFSEQYKKELRETTNMLAAAQMAIYPIASAGLEDDSYYTASNSDVQDMSAAATIGSSLVMGGIMTTDQNNKVQQEHTERFAAQATMDEIAKDTGGEAFYNTNGLKDALAQVIANGAHYYTISYSPTDKNQDGTYRPIAVKLRTGHYKLAYRRGYFAERIREQKHEQEKDQPQTTEDPLRPLMARGMPDSSQILFKVRVLPADHQPDAQTSVAGDNAKLKGPVTRYAVDFAISTKDLALEATPDGMHRGNLEITLVAYDHDGNALNWLVRSMNMSLKPQLYAAFQQGGVQLHQEIDVPKGDMYLRTGVYDLTTNKAGTLEIPLEKMVVAKNQATQ